MKKILSIWLALCLVFLLVGCGKEEEKEKKEPEEPTAVEIINETLDIVVYDRGDDEGYWNAVVDAFEQANAGVTVNMTLTKDAAYVLRDRILSGNSPDFVYLPSGDESGVTEALVKDRAMTSLADVEQVLSSLMLTGAVDNVQCRPYDDGKTYLAPLFFDMEGFIYNKTLLEENGWTLPETWDDLIALAEDCDAKDVAVFSYAGREPEEFVKIFAAALVPSVGTDGMNEMLGCSEEVWKDNESVKAFIEKIEAIKKLVVSGSSTKKAEDVWEDLTDGKALFISGNTADLNELAEDENYEYGFALYPKLDGNGEKTAIVNFSEMYIPFEAKNADLAKKFLIFQYSDEAVKIAAETLGEMTPVLKISTLADQYGLDEETKAMYKKLGTSMFSSRFAVKSAENATLSDEFSALVVSVFKGDVTAEDFTEKMIEFIQDY